MDDRVDTFKRSEIDRAAHRIPRNLIGCNGLATDESLHSVTL
jgi:hypothetical protein